MRPVSPRADAHRASPERPRGDTSVWHNPAMADELEHLRLELSAEWSSKTVTTDPPRYIPHDEWRLTVQLAAESSFRLAHILKHRQQLSWGLNRKVAAPRFTFAANFFPHDWKTSDRVQVSSGFRRVTVTDRALKEDLADERRRDASPQRPSTGSQSPCARYPSTESLSSFLGSPARTSRSVAMTDGAFAQTSPATSPRVSNRWRAAIRVA